MKKVFTLAVTFVFFVTLLAFEYDAPPRIYPEIEAYFKKVEGQNPAKVDLPSLEGLRLDLKSGELGYIDYNYIFYSGQDGNTTQAAQVFLQTQSFAKRFKNVLAHSAGIEVGSVDKALIDELSRIGYKITEATKDNKPVYEVRYSEKAPAIILFAKGIADQAVPTSNVTSIVLCDTTNAGCSQLKTPTTPYYIQLEQSGNTLPQQLDNIAKAINYITKK